MNDLMTYQYTIELNLISYQLFTNEQHYELYLESSIGEHGAVV